MARQRLIISGVGAMVIKHLQDDFDVLRMDVLTPEALAREAGAGVEAAVITGHETFGPAHLGALPDLKLIVAIAAGVDGVDLDAAKARGVAVTNGGDINAADVADLALALFLTHRREIIAGDRHVRENKWLEQRRPFSRSLSAEKVGVVGLGHIGLATARRLEPFGCEIAWWGPRAKPDAPWPRVESLPGLATWATTLIVAARGDPGARGLISREVIDALGPEGLLINVARGFVVDQPALIGALKSGRLGGAALDVFDPEPAGAAEWADVPNVLLSPHMGGATQAAVGRMIGHAVGNVRRHFAGEPLRSRMV